MSCRFDHFYVFADSQTARILQFAALNDQREQLVDRLDRLTSLLKDEEVEGE